jgi:hypothetical protein
MSYIKIWSRWCDVIVLNVHALTEDKNSRTKDICYEELECVCNKAAEHLMKILLADLSAKVDRENIFEQTTGNDGLHDKCKVSDVQCNLDF